MNVGAMKKKPMYSVARTLLGAQSTAYDVDYTDEKYFTTRTWYEHAGMFAAGGAAGVGTERYFTGKGSLMLSSHARIGIGAGIYAAEWSVTSLIKQRAYGRYNGYPQGGFYTGRSQQAKGLLLRYKWWDASRNILPGQ